MASGPTCPLGAQASVGRPHPPPTESGAQPPSWTWRVLPSGARHRWPRALRLPGPSGPQDLIVHVRDVSHPETELQKASVLSALRTLQLPRPLLDCMVEVPNKVDLVPG